MGCHLKLHSGEKPRKCNHCQNKIKTSSILEGHVKLHSGLNPKKCRHCKFKFLDTRGLKDHMITLHGERVTTLISRFLQKRIDETAAKNILKIFCILACHIELRCWKKPKMLLCEYLLFNMLDLRNHVEMHRVESQIRYVFIWGSQS